MTKFSLILHGTLTPGPEAREALKVALGAVLQFDAAELEKTFTSFPSILRQNLSKEEADRLKTSIEMFDGDVEIIPQDELTHAAASSEKTESHFEHDLTLSPLEDVAFETPTLFEKAEEEIPEATISSSDDDFSLELRDPDEYNLLPETEEKEEEIIPSTPLPVVSFEFVEQGEVLGESVQATKPAKGATHGTTTETVETIETENPAIGNATTVSEQPSPSSSHSRVVSQENTEGESEENDSPSDLDNLSATYDPEDPESDWRKAPSDWVPVSRQPRTNDTRFSKPFLVTTILLLIGIAYLLLAPKAEVSSGMTLLFDVEDLLKEQRQILKAKPKKGGKPAEKTAPILQSIPFEKYYSSDISANEITGSMELGFSVRGFEISVVSLAQAEQPLPTKKEYIAGMRAQPWIRRFEATRPISARSQNAEISTTEPSAVTDSIQSRIVLEKAGITVSLIGTYSIRATYYPAENLVRGNWYLSNIPLPSDIDANVLSVREAENDQYEVIATGAFEAAYRLASPTPLREVESAEDEIF